MAKKINGITMKTRQSNKQQKLTIELGTEISIQPEWSDEKIKAFTIGIKPSSYIIINTVSLSDTFNIIKKNDRMIVRYLHSGNIYGFRTKSLGSITIPFKLLFISYPENVEVLSLRKSERVTCNIPANIVLNNLDHKGIVTDMSSGGIKVQINSNAISSYNNISLEMPVSISFPLPGLDGIQTFKGIIKRIDRDAISLSLGINFSIIDPAAKTKLDEYLNLIVDF